MKIRILSRKSDLAIIQAREFSVYLQSKHPFVEIEFLTRSTSGDKDLKPPLSEMPTEGVFTNDLRDELIQNKCDLIVHSWKDLPIEVGNKTKISATIERADKRDILFLKKNKKDFIVQVQAGAGVVADSIPSNEYQETLNKAKGMFTALACLDPQDL